MRYFLILLFCLSAQAETTRIYASLADPIYENLSPVASLSMLDVYAEDKKRISSYIERAVELKLAGDAIAAERGGAMDKRDYLNALRALSKEYNYLVVKANRAFRQAMQKDDFETFSFLIKTGLIDIEQFDQEIMAYYQSGQKCTPIDEIEMYVEYKQIMNARATKQESSRKQSYREYRESRIEKFRARDRAEKEAYEKQVQEEFQQAKEDIREELKSELTP